jgi:hypothetical protein
LHFIFVEFRSFFESKEVVAYYNALNRAERSEFIKLCGEERIVKEGSRYAKKKRRIDDDLTGETESTPTSNQLLTQVCCFHQLIQQEAQAILDSGTLMTQRVEDLLSSILGFHINP